MVSEMETVKNVTNAVNNAAYLANPNPQPMPAQSIGVEFVRQYYTMLNKAPQLLYRFYSEDSTFVHGCLDKHGEVVQYVRGQKQINAKIMSLNFLNCHTKIRQVDSMETIGNGVAIQVIGELSNNGQPLRRFLQTFVLTPQSPNKYYVRNDIFRYQDEVFVEENDASSVVEAETKVENHSEPENYKQGGDLIEKDNYSYQSNGTINSAAATVDQASTVADDAIDGQDDEPESVQEISTEVNTSLVDVSEAKDELVEEEVEVEEEGEVQPAVSDIATAVDTVPLVNNEPKTYASMLSKNFQSAQVSGAAVPAPVIVSKPSTGPAPLALVNPVVTNNEVNIPEASVAVNQQPPVALPKNVTGFPPQRERFTNKKGAFNKRNESRESVKNDSDSCDGENPHFNPSGPKKSFSDDHQLFIGNLLPNCSEDELATIFEKYGKIIEVRINRTIHTVHKPNVNKASRNYGFITFEDPNVVDQVIAQKPIFHGNHRYNVEKKQGRANNNFRDDRNRNNLPNNTIPRNGGNQPMPNPAMRHGPMNGPGGNFGQRPRGNFHNTSNGGPGARNFSGGQSFQNRGNFAGAHQQNR